jgi:hypothetical protein
VTIPVSGKPAKLCLGSHCRTTMSEKFSPGNFCFFQPLICRLRERDGRRPANSSIVPEDQSGPAPNTREPRAMGPADLAQIALELPPEERLDLARQLVESVVALALLNEAVTEGIRRIEDLAKLDG